MAKKRGKILEELIIEVLRNKVLADPIFMRSILRYDADNTFTDPRDIPDLQTVQAQLGSGINKQVYTEADLVDDGGGGFYLPYSLTDEEIILGIRIDYASSSEQLTASYDFAGEAITGFANDDTQTIYVFATGIYAPPVPVPLPVFTLQPDLALTIVQTDDLSLTAAATGATSYQWFKDGSPISGQTGTTLNIYNFAFADGGTYFLRAYNSELAYTDSDNSVITYSGGRAVFNRSQLKSDNSPNGIGRPIIVTDGIKTKTINAGAIGYFSVSATTFDFKQAGSDALTLRDAFGALAPILGGSVSNIYSSPFNGPFYVYNDN